MNKSNYSPVSEFVLLGLSTYRPVQHFLLAFSAVFYVTIVLGNLLVVFAVTFDPFLHSPMYFLLANLSFIDLCFSTLTVPKMIHNLYSGYKTISFQGCVIQIFALHVLGGSEMVLLIAMALDRYVAICKPLHYLTIMSPQMCILLLSGAWVIGLIHAVVQVAFVVHLCIFVYVWPFPTVPVDKFLAILDFMITPILNPIIYTLRNKDMKMAMKRLSSQFLSLRMIS
uniref:olfactory receptor 4F6-like n=1 Tax=Panthera onca TaxID=9690 RepID=UPI00295507D1|nr:olfactory receptor 4F6-like [Panthera onca]